MNKKTTFCLREVLEITKISDERVYQFISYTWIEPVDIENERFDEEDIARIKLISELQDNLGVNDEAIPIVLHLIDQLNHMHRELSQITNE